MNTLKIFIVESDTTFGEAIKNVLSLHNAYEITVFKTGMGCLDNLSQEPGIICMDMDLPDMTGEDLFKKIRALNKNTPIIILSNTNEIQVELSYIKSGAKDFIVKTEHTSEMLWNSIINIKETLYLKHEVELLKERLSQKFNLEKTIINEEFMGEKTLKEYTNDIIFSYLKKYDRNVLKVARKLDIGKSTIYNLLQKQEIKES